MVVVDWIELSDDDDEEEPTVKDLTTEDYVVDDAHLVFPKQELLEAADGVQEAVQPGNQAFLAAGNGVQEAVQPGNVGSAAFAPSSFTEQGVAQGGDCAEEAVRSKHAGEATASFPMTSRDEHQSGRADALLRSPPISTAPRFPRQFWKAGEYNVPAQPSNKNGQNCLRINPKFLHSNATSHKWAFGAIAELLDNAVDEVQNGATYVKIDKRKYSPVGEYSLVIQDDGGGMSPEYLRHCLSFGFSNKCTNSSIGQYGNGFKTSTMRLGADAIIFSCRKDKRLTRSVGLLSYTFLTRTGCNDILVPVVDYEYDPSSYTFKSIMDRGEKHFSANLSTLLRWSPFSTEEDLLNQFGDMGHHGTKIVVYNLWFNDAWEMELDFATDDEDIMISGAPGIPDERQKVKRLTHMHFATRFRYSLRVYASILYLHLPKHFKVILCGRVVEPHHIVNDLMYCECIRYRPQVGASVQVDVITTMGFLKGAPHLNIYGFNIYHRNRLILPFWSPCSERGLGHGKGIVGVLEANFIRPTHDKQDFEKTELFQRLDTRLKDMTTEYWRIHAGLIYPNHAHRSTAKASVVLGPRYSEGNSRNHLHGGVSRDQMDNGACMLTRRNRTSFCMPRIPQQTEPWKRRNSGLVIESGAQKRQNTNDDDPGSVNVAEMGEERSRALIYQNETLKAECLQLEAAGQHLQSKAETLRNKLDEWRRIQKSLIDELQFHEGLSALQNTAVPFANMGVGWI